MVGHRIVGDIAPSGIFRSVTGHEFPLLSGLRMRRPLLTVLCDLNVLCAARIFYVPLRGTDQGLL